jgi:hypothetical protein
VLLKLEKDCLPLSALPQTVPPWAFLYMPPYSPIPEFHIMVAERINGYWDTNKPNFNKYYQIAPPTSIALLIHNWQCIRDPISAILNNVPPSAFLILPV